MAISLVFFGMFFILAVQTYLADSEIWAVTLSKKFFDVGENISIYFKIPFYFLLRLIYEIPGGNFRHFQYARLMFFFVGAGNLILSFYLAKRIFLRSYIAWLSVFLILTTTMYLNRGFRIRSDILSLFFALLFIHLNLNYFESNIRETWKLYLCKFLTMYGLVLGTTPKAMYLIFWNLVFVLLLRFKKEPVDRSAYLKPYCYGIVYPTIAGIIFLIISTIMSWESNNLYAAYYAAWTFFFDALVTWTILDFSSNKFYFFARFIQQNFLLIILALIPMVEALLGVLIKRRITYMNIFLISTLVYFISVFTFNDLLPFFIATWVPFLAISAAAYIFNIPKILGRVVQMRSQKIHFLRTPVVLGLVVYFSINGGEFFLKNILRNTLEFQRSTIQALEKYLEKYPEAKHYDVIGLLPRRNMIYKFVGPGQSYQNRQVVKYIGDTKPDFIFYVRKLSLLEPKLSKILSTHYVELLGGVYSRGITYFARDEGVRSLGKAATSKITLNGREYWVVPSDTIASELELDFPELYNHNIYFYVDIGEGEREKAGHIIYRTGKERIDSVELKEFDPKRLLEKGEFLIDTSVVSASVSPYPPINQPHITHMLLNFSFDTAY